MKAGDSLQDVPGCLEGCLLLGAEGEVRAVGRRIGEALGLAGTRAGTALAQLTDGRPTLRPLAESVRDLRPEDRYLLVALPRPAGDLYLAASCLPSGEGTMVEMLPITGGLVDLATTVDALSNAVTSGERPQIAMLDPRFVFLWANREYIKGSGKSWEQLIGHDHFQLFPNEENERIFMRSRDTGRPVRHHAKAFAFADQPERGTTYWDWTLLPVRGPGGTAALLLTLYDVTPRITMTHQLADRADQLARSNKELSDFAYVASHDLREPLRMIAGYLELVERRLRGQEMDGTTRAYIRYAVDGAKRMDALINDLLTYSRAGAAEAPLVLTDLTETARAAVANLASHIDGAVISIDPLPTVPVDRRQMEQLFQNLIGNALKYRAQRPLRVHVTAHRDRERWIVAVQDNGIGIALQYHERIFEMFQRLHGREEYEGTGIGLAIARKIVERHGGRIWVESKEGEGSTFYFSLDPEGAGWPEVRPASSE